MRSLAYKVARKMLEQRVLRGGRSMYSGVKTEALIMLEMEDNFPIFTGRVEAEELDAGEYSDHDLHDAQHGWPHRLVSSMPIEDFATHITEVCYERRVTDWIEMVCNVSKFVEVGAYFFALSNLYVGEAGGEFVSEVTRTGPKPFNYATIKDTNTTVSWASSKDLEKLIDDLMASGRLNGTTRSTSMDIALSIRGYGHA